MTHSAAAIRALLSENGLSPRRALGQNFVVDPNTVRRVAHISGVGPGDHVVEIGAGLGSLTLALAETGASVLAMELDRDLVPVLRSVVEGLGVDVVEGDATSLDWETTLAASPRWTLVANLPYNVATSLVLDLLRDVDAIEAMVVMVQREAGERLAAGSGSRARGIPSVLVEARGDARLVGRIPAAVFYPRPKVESVLVRIDRHREPVVDDAVMPRLESMVRAAFGQRRKMLRRSLSASVDADAFAVAGVAPTARPEDLTLEQWIALAQAAP